MHVAYTVFRIKRASAPVQATTGLASAVLRWVVLFFDCVHIATLNTNECSCMKLYDRYKNQLGKA